MAEIKYDWKNSLCVVKGISTNTGKPYERFDVKRQDKFNKILIELAKAEGVEVFDITPKPEQD